MAVELHALIPKGAAPSSFDLTNAKRIEIRHLHQLHPKKAGIMITFVSGDILLSKARVVAHGVAPNDEHTSTLARALREQWPAMYKDFRHYCKTCHPKPGSLWTWAAADGRRIVTLFTQEGTYEHGSRPGPASMTHVNHALHALRDLVSTEKISSLALPRLATGVGGLSWDEVRPAIERWLGALPIPISVYSTFHPHQAAQEPSLIGALDLP